MVADIEIHPEAALAMHDYPQNIDAEQLLLGAVLMNNDMFDRVADIVQSKHFSEPLHQRIFDAIDRKVNRGQSATPITLSPIFQNDTAIAELAVSAAEYLAHLAASAVGLRLALDYGREVRELAIRRELINIGNDVADRARIVEPDDEAGDQIIEAEQALYQLAQTGSQIGEFQNFGEALAESVEAAGAAHKRGDRLAGIATGLHDLDNKLGGLHSSDLLILAGRPSMGKTSLATNIAFNIAKNYRSEVDTNGKAKVIDGAVIGFFSLEMSSEQLATRILSEQTEIASEKIRRGQMTDQDFRRLVQASQELEELPLYIDDTPALPMSTLATRARRLKRQHDLGCIIVDYLQLLRPPTGGRGNDNRVQELSDITQGLKALAKELDIPIVALSQLSRAVESRDDKRPQLSDLRESGSIEQDSDVVMFIFREEYYVARSEPSPDSAEYEKWQDDMARVYGKAEVIIGKQRHGPIGKVMLQFQAEFTRFANLADEDRVPVVMD